MPQWQWIDGSCRLLSTSLPIPLKTARIMSEKLVKQGLCSLFLTIPPHRHGCRTTAQWWMSLSALVPPPLIMIISTERLIFVASFIELVCGINTYVKYLRTLAIYFSSELFLSFCVLLLRRNIRHDNQVI